ncbi:MAG: AAA family ATPase [Bacilli bacterium]|nr:AAA family ATPase [Bacilli bacterium]MBP3445591.1 AAA family ATPase [Bacilli bacterium]
MEKYTHVGIVFEMRGKDNNYILTQLNVSKCYVVDKHSYFVKNFDSTLNNLYEGTLSEEEYSIGFVISIKDLLDTYYGLTLEEAMIEYRDDISDYDYIQEYDSENDTTLTYRINPEDDRKILLAKCYNNTFNDTEAVIELNSEIIKTEEEINYEFNIKEVYNYVKSCVIGQDEAVKKAITTIDKNLNIENYRNKTNLLVIGPSGCGKTEIFRSIAEKINLPITIEDSEQYSVAGYQGASVNEMLIKLYEKAARNQNLAEHGILVIDEIDKKVNTSDDDVSGKRFLNSLLSLMEGTTFRINVGSDMHEHYINFNTNNLTIVLLGAFSNIIDINHSMGFNNDINDKKKKYSEITIEDMKKYGVLIDLLRRVNIINVNELSIDDIEKIIKDSKNNCLLEFKNLFSKRNVELDISNEAIRKIAIKSYNKNIGASGIKNTFNELLDNALFEVSMEDIYDKVLITEDSLEKEPPYILIKKRTN